MLFRYFAETLQLTSALQIRKSPIGSDTCVLRRSERRGMSSQSSGMGRCTLCPARKLPKDKRFCSGRMTLTLFGWTRIPKRQVSTTSFQFQVTSVSNSLAQMRKWNGESPYLKEGWRLCPDWLFAVLTKIDEFAQMTNLEIAWPILSGDHSLMMEVDVLVMQEYTLPSFDLELIEWCNVGC